MSLDLTLIQSPLPVTESHSDHTWNISLNDYSAYTDVRLIVDVYSNPYENDLGPNNITGTIQDSGKKARLLVPPNEFGNCIFNVETIIRNFVMANPRNMTMIDNIQTGLAENSPYYVETMQSSLFPITANTSQATLVNNRLSNIGFSNGFNGGFEGFQNIYHINEYRLIFGVQFTASGYTQQIIDESNFGVYSGFTGTTIDPYSAATQPYGVMIWPGVQDNKRYALANNSAFTYYYSGTNLTGQYNYLNTKVYNYAMNTKVAPFNVDGQFMATFGPETLPMTAFGGPIQQTRWRTHYYNCPIVIGFMYGENPLYNNSTIISGITYLLKSQGNGQLNYDTSYSLPVVDTPNPNGYNSFLGQRIAYGIIPANPLVLEMSDVAVYLSSGTCDPTQIDRISEIVQYKMVGKECFNDPYSFLFLNRQGVWDTYTFTKKSQKRYRPKRKTYSSWKTLNTRLWNRQSYDSAETVYFGVSEELFTFASGFVYQNDRDIIEQLLMSPYVYMIMDNYIPETGQPLTYPYLIPCVVQNSDVQVFQQKYQRIFQYTIEIKQTPYRNYDLPY